MMKNAFSATHKLSTFLKEDIWSLDVKELPTIKAFFVKFLKLLLLSWNGFGVDRCRLRAAALTLYTLLSIVPVIAMLFGIAKGFGLEEMLRKVLLEQLRDQQAIALKLIDFSQSLLANTQGEVVAGIGIAFLFWSVMSAIGEIEKSFNYIWKVEADRTFGRKISDYLSLMLLAPLLLITSSSITVYVQSHLSGLAQGGSFLHYGSSLLLRLFGYVSLLIVWLVFSVTFIFMPNTKVSFKSGILAGILSGTVFQLAQWAYLRLQIGVSSYNAIYGSFAALPLFIIWLQIGWQILLYGAEFAFYHQNFEEYRHKNQSASLSFAQKKIAALRIAQLIVHRFAAAETPLNAEQIAQTLHLPILTVQQIIADLRQAYILAPVQTDAAGRPAYLPARDIGLLNVSTIIEALENSGSSALPADDSFERIKEVSTQFNDVIKKSPENRLLKDI